MSFFLNMKWFFEDVVYKIEDASRNVGYFAEHTKTAVKDLGEEAKELIDETKDEFRNLTKELKNDFKDEVSFRNEKAGEMLDKADRIASAIGNNIPKRKVKRDELWEGDHLSVTRFVYTHHALYIGDGEVIHFKSGEIQVDSLENFALGIPYKIINSPQLYESDEIVSRAFQKLVNKDYNLITNNCEQFVNWCRNGSRYSNNI